MIDNIRAASAAAMWRTATSESDVIVQSAPDGRETASAVAGGSAALTSVNERTVHQIIQSAQTVLRKKQALSTMLVANSDGKSRHGASTVDAARADSTLAMHQLTSNLLAAPSLALPSEESQTDLPRATDREFLRGVVESIKDLEVGYLKVFETAVSENVAFHTDFAAIYSDLATYIEVKESASFLQLRKGGKQITGKDGKMDKEAPGLLDLLEALEKKYNGEGGSGVLVADKTYAEALKWAEQMGLPSTVVKETENDKWQVMVDMSPVTKMIGDLKKLQHETEPYRTRELKPAVFNAWKSGFEGHEATIKNNSSKLASKFAAANASFENTVKVLVATIQALLDTNKAFLN